MHGLKTTEPELHQSWLNLTAEERAQFRKDHMELKASALREQMQLTVNFYQKDSLRTESGSSGEYYPLNVWRDRFHYNDNQLKALKANGDCRFDESIQDWEYCKDVVRRSRNNIEESGKSSKWAPAESSVRSAQADVGDPAECPPTEIDVDDSDDAPSKEQGKATKTKNRRSTAKKQEQVRKAHLQKVKDDKARKAHAMKQMLVLTPVITCLENSLLKRLMKPGVKKRVPEYIIAHTEESLHSLKTAYNLFEAIVNSEEVANVNQKIKTEGNFGDLAAHQKTSQTLVQMIDFAEEGPSQPLLKRSKASASLE